MRANNHSLVVGATSILRRAAHVVSRAISLLLNNNISPAQYDSPRSSQARYVTFNVRKPWDGSPSTRFGNLGMLIVAHPLQWARPPFVPRPVVFDNLSLCESGAWVPVDVLVLPRPRRNGRPGRDVLVCELRNGKLPHQHVSVISPPSLIASVRPAILANTTHSLSPRASACSPPHHHWRSGISGRSHLHSDIRRRRLPQLSTPGVLQHSSRRSLIYSTTNSTSRRNASQTRH
jgi:hypothetical protein